MTNAFEKQRANIVQKQVAAGKKFKVSSKQYGTTYLS